MKILLSLVRRLMRRKRNRVGPGRRWQPGVAEVFGVPALERAFLRVRANNGGPGGDGVTLAAFDRTRAQQLFALSAALITGVHRPGPSRRLMIAKPGGARPLCIPTVSDRIAQTAWLMALAPILDKRMHKASFAYRPGLVVTSVPKVPIWKPRNFKMLRHTSRDNILI